MKRNNWENDRSKSVDVRNIELRKTIPNRKGVHYRKISHCLYVVWLFAGGFVDFGNSRIAKQLFKTEKQKEQ